MADTLKYGIIYCGYNTEEYIVDSITPFLDRDNFVVSAVSVPFEEYKDVDDFKDNTTDILRELVEQRKLKYLVDKPAFIKEHDARNLALQSLAKYNIDYIWLVDSDEIYTKKQIDDICKYVKSSGANFFSLSLKNFVFDKKHYLEQPFCPPRIFKTKVADSPLTAFYWDNDGSYMCSGRLMAWGQEFISAQALSYKQLGELEAVPADIAFIDHYSWLNNEIGKRKVAYQLKHFGHCGYKWNDEQKCLEFDEEFHKKNNENIPTVKAIS